MKVRRELSPEPNQAEGQKAYFDIYNPICFAKEYSGTQDNYPYFSIKGVKTLKNIKVTKVVNIPTHSLGLSLLSESTKEDRGHTYKYSALFSFKNTVIKITLKKLPFGFSTFGFASPHLF